MAVLHVTYSDNTSGMKIGTLHDLIWRASPRDIERALFGDASSFAARRDIHIPKVPARCVSAVCRPLTFFFSPSHLPLLSEQSHLISTSGGTMSGPPCSQPLPTALYQCPVIKMSPFNFRSVALLSAEFLLQCKRGGVGGGGWGVRCNRISLFTGNKQKKDAEGAMR